MAGAAGLAAWKFWPEQGLWNPCHGGATLPFHRTEFVRSAFEGLDQAKVWDAHVHVAGTGDSPSGIYVNPRMNRDRKSTRLNSSHIQKSRMPSSA